jgi:crossover junction endodeoxyribonuclease RuvC
MDAQDRHGNPRIIGIDPGLTATGIGVVMVDGERCLHLHHSVVRTRPADGVAARLAAIRDAVRDAARHWLATEGAIEAGFVANNARSALALGQARAAAILGLADAGLPVSEYAATVVKQSVAGYGLGEKAQVAQMVRLQLGMSSLPAPADAADALAIAITHWAHARVTARLREGR